MEYNDLLTEYLWLYDRQDPETRSEWKVNIDPKWRATRSTLTAWKAAIDAGESGDPLAAELAAMEAILALSDILIAITPLEE